MFDLCTPLVLFSIINTETLGAWHLCLNDASLSGSTFQNDRVVFTHNHDCGSAHNDVRLCIPSCVIVGVGIVGVGMRKVSSLMVVDHHGFWRVKFGMIDLRWVTG